MDKQIFTNIIQNHTFSDDDVKSFQELVEQYPYSQILHTLIAKHHNEVKSDQAKILIHRAAIYATDRIILKKILDSNAATVRNDTSSTEASRVVERSKFEPTVVKTPTTGISDIDQLRKNLLINLEQLQESKKLFGAENKETEKKIISKAKTKEKSKLKKKDIESKDTTIVNDTSSTEASRVAEQSKFKPEVVKIPANKFATESTGISDIDQLRKDLLIKLEQLQESKKLFGAENKETEKKIISKAKTKEKSKLKKKDKVKQKHSTLKKKKGKNKKGKKDHSPLSQKEQVDLIEKFITSPPKIPKGKVKSDADKHQEDLSINSTKIEEDFASENLAQILIKQGNKEKAIDIYKKLIWKFPQKKAYFATQIEGLKK